MKFIHTADWQLGMKAAHVGGAAPRVREERLAAARRVVAVAREHGAEFLLIAGDVFEDNGMERALIQKVADILGGCQVPVYLIPGNHDPFTPGSVWEHPAWKSMEHVHVLREEKPVDIPGGILYPCPVKDKRSRKDPTAWIPSAETGTIRIGLAHGTVEGVPQAEPDHPIPRNAAARAGLDYLALGHWHSMATYPEDGVVRMAYSGTHETTSFGERDSGNVLVVEIAEPGAAPVTTPVRTGGLTWKVVEKDIREPGDLLRVRQYIESQDNPGSTLVDLQLKGLLAAGERGEVARIEEIAASRFLFARVDAAGLRPSPDDASWMAGLPPGILQNVAARLQELSDPRFVGQRPEGASPEVASRALMELYALVPEVSP
ncbi:MAG: DNA repair exonuclease [Planctomycetota bacterium]|nr:DNA repair exonuclease [Planctomycetota bacterium]